jgi:hypothetical protein
MAWYKYELHGMLFQQHHGLAVVGIQRCLHRSLNPDGRSNQSLQDQSRQLD